MGAKSILKVISQISACRQHVHTPFITKLSIFDRKRANWFGTNQYETPCTCKKEFTQQHVIFNSIRAQEEYQSS